ACILDPGMQGLSRREQLAISFLDRLTNDHDSINASTFAELSEVFSNAEIVELGWRCATLIGSHRFIHCLDMLGDSQPVLPFDPKEIDRTTAPNSATENASEIR